MSTQESTRLDAVMSCLGLTAIELSHHCSVSNSLISRWRRGTRRLTVHSDAALELAATLVELDTNQQLDELLAPYLIHEKDRIRAMWLYLVDPHLAPVADPEDPPPSISETECMSQQRILFGNDGFYKAAFLMLDYLERLPDGQEVIICANNWRCVPQDKQDLARRFSKRFQHALNLRHHITIVENVRNESRLATLSSPAFAHYVLDGTLRALYVDAEASECFIATISGHWSANVELDRTISDGIVTTISTDTFHVQRDQRKCLSYLSAAKPVGQLDFFARPEDFTETLTDHPELEAFHSTSLTCLSRLPVFGVMTDSEFESMGGTFSSPSISRLLFRSPTTAPSPTVQLILCQEDIKDALQVRRATECPALSALLCRDVALPYRLLHRLTTRIVAEMYSPEPCSVALAPRALFESLGIEFATWSDTVALTWLPDVRASSLDIEQPIVDSVSTLGARVWEALPPQAKDIRSVRATLEEWLMQG